MSWRVFTGDMEEEFSWVDKTVDEYDMARLWMLKELVKFLDDACEDCRDQGTEAALELLRFISRTGVSSVPEVWSAEVDGHLYMIEYVP